MGCAVATTWGAGLGRAGWFGYCAQAVPSVACATLTPSLLLCVLQRGIGHRLGIDMLTDQVAPDTILMHTSLGPGMGAFHCSIVQFDFDEGTPNRQELWKFDVGPRSGEQMDLSPKVWVQAARTTCAKLSACGLDFWRRESWVDYPCERPWPFPHTSPPPPDPTGTNQHGQSQQPRRTAITADKR